MKLLVVQIGEPNAVPQGDKNWGNCVNLKNLSLPTIKQIQLNNGLNI